MTFKFKVAAAAVAFLAIGAAQAQKSPEPDFTIAYNVGAVSQYRFRGIEQTSGAPALQAGVDFAHKNGFYAGLFTSNVTWVRDFNGATSGEREVDFFLGVKTEIANGLTLDIGAIQYMYPGNNSGLAGTPGTPVTATPSYTNANTTEGYFGLTYGITSFKYSQSFGDFLGNYGTNGSRYIELALNFDLGNGMTLVPHIGRQTVANVINAGPTFATNADYTDYSLTLNKDFGNGWSASLAAIGTNAQQGGFYSTTASANPSGVNRFLGSNTGVVGVKYTF
jgi:uncharacterized protein (TIGR02001 family)